MVHTGVLDRFDDHRQAVDTDGKALGNLSTVDIVASILAQLGHAGMEITDLEVLALDEADHRQGGANSEDRQRRPGPGEAGHGPPEPVALGLRGLTARAVAFEIAQLHERQQYRQQQQVGEDDGAHTQACSDRHLLDDADVDQENGDKTQHVAGQRQTAGNDQPLEGAAGSFQGIDAGGVCGRRNHFQAMFVALAAVEDLAHPAGDHLHTVADADREHQEGNQDTHGIQAETEHRQQTQLPDHRHQRDHQWHHRELDGPGIEEQQNRGDGKGDAKEADHIPGAIRDIPGRFGEADDADLDVVGLESIANLRFQVRGHLLIVQGLPGRRVTFDQLGTDQRTGEVVGHQTAHPPGFDDVVAYHRHPFRGRLEFGRHHVAAAESILDDLDITNIRREDGGYRRARHAGQEEHLVGGQTHRLEELRIEDVAFFLEQGHDELITAAEILFVLLQRLDVRMLQRQQLLEPGVDTQLERVIAHPYRQAGENQQHQPAIIEQQFFHAFGDGSPGHS